MQGVSFQELDGIDYLRVLSNPVLKVYNLLFFLRSQYYFIKKYNYVQLKLYPYPN